MRARDEIAENAGSYLRESNMGVIDVALERRLVETVRARELYTGVRNPLLPERHASLAASVREVVSRSKAVRRRRTINVVGHA